jgi:Uma2 family endonuclease
VAWRGARIHASRSQAWKVALNIGAAIQTFAKQHQLGTAFAAETGFIVRTPQGESVLAPDAAFICRERLPQGEFPAGFCTVIPDLVVEVVSPSDSYADMRQKVDEWLAAGVSMVWVVDPQRRAVEIWQPGETPQNLGEQDLLLGDPILPGFQLPVKELFE